MTEKNVLQLLKIAPPPAETEKRIRENFLDLPYDTHDVRVTFTHAVGLATKCDQAEFSQRLSNIEFDAVFDIFDDLDEFESYQRGLASFLDEPDHSTARILDRRGMALVMCTAHHILRESAKFDITPMMDLDAYLAAFDRLDTGPFAASTSPIFTDSGILVYPVLLIVE